MHATKLFNVLITLILTLSFSSCSHYSMIPTSETPFKSIYLHTISNQDFAPNVHILFQNQIKQTILSDSQLSLTKTPQEADIQLYIKIEDYKRNAITRSSVDAGRFNSHKLGLVIQVSLYDNKKNTFLLNDVTLDSSENLFFDSEATSQTHRELEYQILPKVTRDLSEKILQLILHDWPEFED